MTALVTGASRGLGLGLCTVLAERGETVLAVCREPTPELSALSVRIIPGIDVATSSAVEVLRRGVASEALDLVICNAGVNMTFDADGIETLDLAAAEREYQINTLGAVRTVVAVLPRLARGSKIALITTAPTTMRRNPRNPGNYGYRMSKAALNVFGYLLADELRARGILVMIVSPGPVNTAILRAAYDAGRTIFEPNSAPDPVTAARAVLSNIDALTPDGSGSWVDQDGKSWA